MRYSLKNNIERRFQGLIRVYKLDTQELREKMIRELHEIFMMAHAIAKGEVKTQTVDGRQVKITLTQRRRWAQVAAYIAQIINSIAKGFDEHELDEMLKEARRLLDEAEGGRAKGHPRGAEEKEEGEI